MKRRTLLLIFLLTAPSLMAQQGGCVALATGSNQKAGGAFASTFSAAEVVDVDLSVVMTPGMAKKLAGDHIVEVRIFNPRGDLYQSISVPVTAERGRAGETAMVPGYPRPMKKQHLSETKYDNGKHFRAIVRLAVAGTIITRNSMFGSWTAEAFIDATPLKCSKPAQFTITP